MERFNELGRGLQLMLVASVLLLIDSFLNWQQADFELGGETITSVGVSGWHGVGIIMGLLTVVLIVWLVVRLAASHIALPVSDAMTGALLGFLLLAFTVIKFLVDGEFRHWPAWVGLLLAIIIAVGAWMAVQEAGGVQTLQTEASSMTSGGGASSASTAPPPASTTPPPPPPPAAAPPPPPAAPAEPTMPDRPSEGYTPDAPSEGDRPA
jgi:hypothetical protein